jgi:hypothetical protein
MKGKRKWQVQDRWRYKKRGTQFERISIPLTRRIYPQLIANNIVSVQPMMGPASLAYYLRHKYSGNSQYAAS